MPPVDIYQRIDRQNTDETSHQVNKKSVDQTRNEARIENLSARDTIEESDVALSNISAGNNGKGINTTLSVGNQAVSEFGATSDLAVNSQLTADQDDGLIASNDIGTSSKKDFRYSSEQTDDQFSKAESYTSADENNTVENDTVGNDTVLDRGDAIERSPSYTNGISSRNGFIEDVGGANNSSVEGSLEMIDDAHIDSIENLTVEQAFDFLTEQTEDNYEEPARLPL